VLIVQERASPAQMVVHNGCPEPEHHQQHTPEQTPNERDVRTAGFVQDSGEK
jgi:hypothetical protein